MRKILSEYRNRRLLSQLRAVKGRTIHRPTYEVVSDVGCEQRDELVCATSLMPMLSEHQI